MFLTAQFQEFMQQEKQLYSGISEHLNNTLANQLDFTYQSVFQLFCHLSILHNTQAQVLQALMRMIGSLVESGTKVKEPDVVLQNNPTKFTPPNFFDIFEDKQSQEPLPQQLLNTTQDKKKQSILTQIEQPKDRMFRESVRTRKEREQMDGHFCVDCEKFYNAFPKDAKVEKWKQDHSRHRANHKMNQEKLLLTPE